MKTLLTRLLVGLLLVPTFIWQVNAQDKEPKIVSTDPNEKKDPLITEAEELYRKGEVDKSFKKLEEAVKKTPTLPPARLMLARLVLSTRDQGQAGRQLLEIATRERPDHPECYLTNASIALAEGRITDTILNCGVALNQANEAQWTQTQAKTFRREANAGLATAYEARQAWLAARKHLSDWSELEPDNAQVLQRLARAMFLTGQADEEVLAKLRAAVKVAEAKADKKDPNSNTNLDMPEVTMGQFYAGRGSSETDAKKSDEDLKKAEDWFKKAIEANKALNKARPHQAYGGWLLDTRKFKEAKEQIDLAKKIDPTARETQALIGLQARYDKDYPAAATIFQTLVNKTPDDFFSLNQLALVLIEATSNDEKQKGVKHAENNAARYQQSAEAFATLGWAYFKSDRFAEAEAALARATNSGQASADTAYYLSKLLFHKAKKAEKAEDAKDLYKRAFDVLDQALKSKGVFVNHADATLFLEVLRPLAPKEEKKPDPKGDGTSVPPKK